MSVESRTVYLSQLDSSIVVHSKLASALLHLYEQMLIRLKVDVTTPALQTEIQA